MDKLTEMLVSDFMPHGHCYFWRPDILWTHVLSDAGIALAYFCIPGILVYYLIKKKPQKIPFWWVIILFAAFIYLCGITHIIGIVTVWTPIYIIEGWLKAATALVSVITAITLIPLVPKALTLKSAEELAQVNDALNSEIRERDQIQRQLHRTVTDLQNANQELEDITSITAHDLQAPLRRMITFSDALRSKLRNHEGLDADIHKLAESIEQNGMRMRQHLEAVMNFSTLNTEDSDYESVETSELIDKVLKEVLLGQEGIEVEIGEMPRITTSPRVMYHVISNLVDNAIKYRDPERKLSIKISAEKIQSDDDAPLWKFSVEDNGTGFDPVQADKIFKLFGRLHTNKESPGSGIGLATVKKLLTAHAGNIWVNSEEGVGSCFHFTLPDNRTV